MAGLRTYTVQESENVDLGQLGSMYTINGQAAITPPSGHVFVAIQSLSDYLSFDDTGGLVSEDNNRFINSESDSQGGAESDNGGEQMGGLVGIPPGTIIYGRWTEIDLKYGSCIAYIGK